MSTKPVIEWPERLELHRIDSQSALEQWTPTLTKLLQSCVNDDPASSSIGFLAPLSNTSASAFWLSLSPQLFGPQARTTLFVLARGSSAVGTVHITTHPKATHVHKVEVAKLLVSAEERGLGLGRKLMDMVERFAKEELGKTMIMLDTATDTPARGFYLKLGYIEWGICPNYSQNAIGHLHGCSFFYKSLDG